MTPDAPVVRSLRRDGPGRSHRLGFLGVTIDPTRSATASPDTEITGHGGVRVFVLAAREDLEITRGVRAALAPR